MRMWPYQMLDVLPAKHLVSQWRECLAISGSIKIKGFPNHYIVNRVMDYPMYHFAFYCNMVRNEMIKRGYRVGWNTIEKLDKEIDFSNNDFSYSEIVVQNVDCIKVKNEILFENWHNKRYLTQCLFSFQERFDCSGIKDEDWILMKDKFSKIFSDS